MWFELIKHYLMVTMGTAVAVQKWKTIRLSVLTGAYQPLWGY